VNANPMFKSELPLFQNLKKVKRKRFPKDGEFRFPYRSRPAKEKSSDDDKKKKKSPEDERPSETLEKLDLLDSLAAYEAE